jgi:hypothetical protein
MRHLKTTRGSLVGPGVGGRPTDGLRLKLVLMERKKITPNQLR